MGHMKSPSIFRAALLVSFGALGLSSVAHAQRKPSIGADIGYAYLLDSKARSAFGSGVVDYGLGFGSIAPSLEGKVGLDISILRPRDTQNGVKSDALVISVGPEYRKVYLPGNSIDRVIAQQQQNQQQQLPPDAFPPGTPIPRNVGGLPSTLPYYGASVNLIYAQVNAPDAGVDGNGFGVGGSVFAGLTFNSRFYLEGRVRATSDVESFNFSRAGVEAGVRF